MKTKKQLAIERCAIFLSDRIEVAMQTRKREHTTKEAIKQMLEREFDQVPDGGEAKL